MTALKATDFIFPGQTAVYKGKVRDVYTIDNRYMVMVASDRISAFDVVLPEGIPFKGQVLNQTARYFLEKTAALVPNWFITSPDPNVSIGHLCKPFKVEMVIRGYLAGHAAREYAAGKRAVCGVSLPERLRENDPLPAPIITPTTKADAGHDIDISREDILKQGIVLEEDYVVLEKYTRILFEEGTRMAAERGLLLVDTKYEFGKTNDGTIVLIDEIHTPDSSRYFYSDGFQQRQDKGEQQKQLSKEFVRKWLIENGFQGKEGQQVPLMTPALIDEVSERYIELFETITGEQFIPRAYDDIENNIQAAVSTALQNLRSK
ncbi:MAG: phosphoribosylaminoimidazolesuccinocarboxamide synthase [Bacteroidia bacterium]|nr:phosphoribosylaminoimidazolesuccinocarboxamide synthase [Bacteroidia bacterium]MCC6768746.1 phosphoribosylaminoimidazolesuccinocarboxamide synthase [Bacteroidia bacterium]